MRTTALLTCSALLLVAACDAPNIEEYGLADERA